MYGRIHDLTLEDRLRILGCGSHACLIYDSAAEQHAAVVSWLKIGLERDERCIYVLDENSRDDVLDALERSGIDPRPAVKNRSLLLVSKQDTYLRDGSFDPDRMIGFLKEATDRARSDGFTALRVTGEMTWSLSDAAGSERLIEYESKLNNFLPDSSCLALCQYNRKRFPAHIIRDVIFTHPLVIHRNTLCDNMFYVPPEEFMDPDATLSQVERLLAGVFEQQNTNDQLKNQKHYYSELMQSMQEHIYVVDREYTITEVNHAFLQAKGLDRYQVLGRPCHFICHGLYDPCDRNGIPCQVERVFKEGKKFSCTHRHFKDDTAPGRSVDLSFSPLFDRWGEVSQVVVAGREMDELLEMQDKLRQSEEFHRAVLNSISDSVFITDDRGNLTFVCPNVDTIFGYTVDEAVEIGSIRRLLGGDVYSAHELDEKGELENLEREVTDKWGRKHTLLISVKRIPLGGGTVLYSCRDITERNRTEETLRLQAAVLDQIQDLVTVTDMEGKILYVNDAECRILKRSREEMIGSPVTLFGSDSENGISQEEIIKATLEHGQWQGEVVNYDADGKRIILDCRTQLVCDLKGSPVGMCGISTDITARRQREQERRNLEERLRHAQRLESIGKLAGGVAHDLNNMITPILGYAELLEGGERPQITYSKGLEEIQKAANRARRLTSQLLAFSRRQVMKMEKLQLCRVVLDLKPMLERTVRENIKIEVRQDSCVGYMSGDTSQIEQILLNLAVNAQEAMPRGGRLIMSLKNAALDQAYASTHPGARPGEYVLLEVSDTGQGMDSTTMSRIFEPFFTTKIDGTGLGMSTVYGVVKQHGGYIDVYSEQEKGTTFRIYFPRVHDAQQVPDPAAAGEDSARGPDRPKKQCSGSGTVLVVEDNEMVRELTCMILKSHGYDVLEASGSLHGLEMALKREGAIDLLLTDVIMPDLNGRELYERVAEKQPDIRVLYMSGYPSTVITHHGVLDEGVQFIQKPFQAQDLLLKVAQVMDIPSSKTA
jgi:PAS domain S-box-containing protein